MANGGSHEGARPSLAYTRGSAQFFELQGQTIRALPLGLLFHRERDSLAGSSRRLKANAKHGAGLRAPRALLRFDRFAAKEISAA